MRCQLSTQACVSSLTILNKCIQMQRKNSRVAADFRQSRAANVQSLTARFASNETVIDRYSMADSPVIPGGSRVFLWTWTGHLNAVAPEVSLQLWNFTVPAGTRTKLMKGWRLGHRYQMYQEHKNYILVGIVCRFANTRTWAKPCQRLTKSKSMKMISCSDLDDGKHVPIFETCFFACCLSLSSVQCKFDWKQVSLAKVDPMNLTQSTEPHRHWNVLKFSVEILIDVEIPLVVCLCLSFAKAHWADSPALPAWRPDLQHWLQPVEVSVLNSFLLRDTLQNIAKQYIKLQKVYDRFIA